MRYRVILREEGLIDEDVIFDTEAVEARLRSYSTDDGSNTNDLWAAIEVLKMYERRPCLAVPESDSAP